MKKSIWWVRVAVFSAGLLLALIFFQPNIAKTGLIEVVGRLHPLIIHLPIGLLFALILDYWVNHRGATKSYNLTAVLLPITTISAILAAIAGIVLSAENPTDSLLLDSHKQLGLWFTFSLFISWFLLHTRKSIYPISLLLATGLMFATGHFGGSITHGKDFLLEPLKSKEIEKADLVYQDVVKPILREYCTKCHNDQRQKGALNLSSFASIQAGGENGAVIVAGDALSSEIIRRIHLPTSEELHMPPTDQKQIKEADIEFLEAWINAGASDSLRIAEVDPDSDLGQVLANRRPKQKQYDFAGAKKSTIEGLNSPYCYVAPIAPGSPALEARIMVAQAFDPKFLADLEAVKKQLIRLDISRLPLQDEHIDALAPFLKLEELFLNETSISDQGLSVIQTLPKLELLAIAGTDISASGIRSILNRPNNLRNIYAWNSNITQSDKGTLASEFPNTVIHLGYLTDSEAPIPLSPPEFKNEKAIMPVESKIEIASTFPETVIRYTTDGSIPDSTAQLYEGPIAFHQMAEIQARVFKEEWLPSEPAIFHAMHYGLKPLKLDLRTEPNQKYAGIGPKLLVNDTRGDIVNFGSNEWLGFKDNQFDIYYDYGPTPPTMAACVIAYGTNHGAYIMPPKKINIWGGNAENDLIYIKTVIPDQPTGYDVPEESTITIPLDNLSYQFYRIKIEPVNYLPPWHNGHKTPGWFFVDEILFYGAD